MPEPNPTVRARELGTELRRLREQKKLSGGEVARMLGISASKMSRLENGRRNVKVEDVASLLTLYRVVGPVRDELLDLARGSEDSGWLQRFGSHIPKELKSLINQESEARRIRNYETMLIPGLLQTGEYARATMGRSVSLPPGDVEQRVITRTARQALLTREHPPVFSAIITEHALRTPVGGATVMSGQLRYLADRASRPHIEVRVLPTAIGSHAGMCGPFSIMDFASVSPVVYLENELSGHFLDEPAEVDIYDRIFTRLEEESLDPTASLALIAEMADELGRSA